MKIKKTTKAFWKASETARGIKVTFVIKAGLQKSEHYTLGKELFFDSIEEVKKYCKGTIILMTRKVTTSKNTIVSK